jgi:hypothetical protein
VVLCATGTRKIQMHMVEVAMEEDMEEATFQILPLQILALRVPPLLTLALRVPPLLTLAL